ncbi:hypothetical protein E6R18_04995 [Streptomyces sp. A1277]|uniref:hypothetical protein n=1 Tax=Streptomyces sp. A1277 TaxID=2563103 RepID=UPI0010A2636E|nr:hypothetical protein [Streptomyces sp. A1277]THA35080.1 hypothetical protein E6R18_04995 [Streptomyces sp. A1277]
MPLTDCTTSQVNFGRDGGHYDADTVISQLEELADWQPMDEEGWYTNDSSRWHQAFLTRRFNSRRPDWRQS